MTTGPFCTHCQIHFPSGNADIGDNLYLLSVSGGRLVV